MVETKGQREKVKKLGDTQNIDGIMGAFEEIYSIKTSIDVKDIFKACKGQLKRVLIFGRAGVGKSTFCQYVAYQWATGAIWPEYELIVLIPLRSLTEQEYQAGIDYYLVDILKKQYFSNLRLTHKDEKHLEEQIRKSRILWLLDGYDEIVQNKSTHLQRLVAQLFKTPDHIVTSRPYLTNLSYPVYMEITGFTDENISKYVKFFFDQLANESQNPLDEAKKLLSFLKLNPRIWGIAHIPINLELICSVWSNTDWSKTKTMTLTMLYSRLTGWICRRYLEKQLKIPTDEINLLDTENVYQKCQNELVFLETLAFYGMETNSILLSADLLKKAKKESKCLSMDHTHLLNIGILKSSTQPGTGTRIEIDKEHYFVHLSFQEYFAARYLVNAFRDSKRDKAIDFIQKQKYNQRFRQVFIFATGLLMESDEEQIIDKFWNTLLSGTFDLVGIRHMDLLISCFDEIERSDTFIYREPLMDLIIKWVEHALIMPHDYLCKFLQQTVRSCGTINNNPILQATLIKLLKNKPPTNIPRLLSFISSIQLTNPIPSLVNEVILQTMNADFFVKIKACNALNAMDEIAATSEVMNGLVCALGNSDSDVRRSVCMALNKMADKATSEVINRLVSALGDRDSGVRRGTCDALGCMGEKVITNEVMNGFVSALCDSDTLVRSSVCTALSAIGEKAATNEVIKVLVSALFDRDSGVRRDACMALAKIGNKTTTGGVIKELVSALRAEYSVVRIIVCDAFNVMGEKAATNEVMNGLVSVLRDSDCHVRRAACEALGAIGEKEATNEVINGLVNALGEKDFDVRSSACMALGKIGDKAATSEVIKGLVSALGDEDSNVRSSACIALGKIGDKAVTDEVIKELVSALSDKNFYVRRSAYNALNAMGEIVATSEVMNGLMGALGDTDSGVRNGARMALSMMYDKAATSVVINQRVDTFGSEESYVRISTCNAFITMGEKTETNIVIKELVNTLQRIWTSYEREREFRARNILSIVSILAMDTTKKHEMSTGRHLFEMNTKLRSASAEKFLEAYMNTADSIWIPAVVCSFVLNGVAATAIGNILWVYDREEVACIPISNQDLIVKLQEAFEKEVGEMYGEIREGLNPIKRIN